MLIKTIVSSVEGPRCRVAVGSQVSAALPRLQLATEGQQEYPLLPGDIVLVAFLSEGYGNGVILGRVSG